MRRSIATPNWILALVASLTAASCASPGPARAPATNRFDELHIDAGIDATRAEEAKKALERVEAFYDGLLPRPEVMRVFRSSDSPAFYSNGTLSLPIRFGACDPPTPIWTHEYSHAYLNFFLRDRNPIMKEVGEISDTILKTRGPAQQAAFDRQGDPVLQAFLNNHFKPYDELFADLAAVILANDPSAISSCLKELDDEYDTRDFSRFRASTTIPARFTYPNLYTSTVYLRGELWSIYKNIPERKKPRFILWVAETIAERMPTSIDAPAAADLKIEFKAFVERVREKVFDAP